MAIKPIHTVFEVTDAAFGKAIPLPQDFTYVQRTKELSTWFERSNRIRRGLVCGPVWDVRHIIPLFMIVECLHPESLSLMYVMNAAKKHNMFDLCDIADSLLGGER